MNSIVLTPDDRELRDAAVAQLAAAFFTAYEISAQLNIPIVTVYSILRQPHVKAQLADNRSQHLRKLLAHVEGEVEKTVDVLVEIRDTAMKNQDRLRASESLLKWYLDIQERAETMQRLAAVEARIAEAVAPKALNAPPDDGVFEPTIVPQGLVADDDAPDG